MPPSDNAVFAWLEALDELSYYELFGLDPVATADDIQAAFHVFCDTFHPDGHVGRDEAEQRALTTIFKRGTEAHAVLVEPGLRAQYDAQLAAKSTPNPATTWTPRTQPSSRRCTIWRRGSNRIECQRA